MISMKSICYKLVSPDRVIMAEGSKKAMYRLRKAKGAGWFVGLGSFSSAIGQKWN